MVDSSTVTMVTAGVKEKGKKRSKSQKRADLLSVSPDAQDAEDPAHKAAKVSKDTAKGKKQKKSKERADASDQAPTSKKSKTVTDTEFTGLDSGSCQENFVQLCSCRQRYRAFLY